MVDSPQYHPLKPDGSRDITDKLESVVNKVTGNAPSNTHFGMKVPADHDTDLDLIASEAMTEIERLRAGLEQAATALTETADWLEGMGKYGGTVMGIRNDANAARAARAPMSPERECSTCRHDGNTPLDSNPCKSCMRSTKAHHPYWAPNKTTPPNTGGE